MAVQPAAMQLATLQRMHHQGAAQRRPGTYVARRPQHQRHCSPSQQHSRRLVINSSCMQHTCNAWHRGRTGRQGSCCYAAVMPGLQTGVGCAGERSQAGSGGEHAACWFANGLKAARLEAASPPGLACPGQLHPQHCHRQHAPVGAAGHIEPWISAEQTCRVAFSPDGHGNGPCSPLQVLSQSSPPGGGLTSRFRMPRPAAPAALPVAARSCRGRWS